MFAIPERRWLLASTRKDQQKSVSLIELAHDGTVDVTEFPIKPLRQVRTIRGKLLELLAATEVSN
jgi:exonuclease SbcD